jgi:prepilin-type N-terminal cleavage/methylation domain-containing protein
MRVRAKRKTNRGFTIIEVMLALALFGVVVTTFTVAYLNIINAIAAIQVDQAYEQDMSMIRLEAFSSVLVEDLEEGGKVFTGSHGEAYWKCEYESTLVADLFRVSLLVEIFDKEKDEMKEVEEVHYLTRPTWSDPVERAELRAETRDRLLAKQSGLD